MEKETVNIAIDETTIQKTVPYARTINKSLTLKGMENKEMIEYEFSAKRVFMRPEEETVLERILRDSILLKFQFDIEKEIVRLRAFAEEELNKSHLV